MRPPTASQPVSVETSSSNSLARPPSLTLNLGPTTLSLMALHSQSMVRTSPPWLPMGSPWLDLACLIIRSWPEPQLGHFLQGAHPPTLFCSTAPSRRHQRAACSTYSTHPFCHTISGSTFFLKDSTFFFLHKKVYNTMKEYKGLY